jgi:F0F1-type ATP synthase assembly protein I
MEEKQPQKKSDRAYYLFALKIVGDFGASIAVPVVVFALLGQWLDEKYHSAPWLMVVGFALAAFREK